ncbi:MAG: hypothetical protein INR70_30060 [Parafilimonas terrae]|nr:hypothetical protein [Parafilimonas terrae]
MTNPRDIASWAEANVALSPEGASDGLSLTGYQRHVVEALAEPGVTVRFLTPAELRRHRGLSPLDALLMLAAADAGEEVLFYERARGELRDAAAGAKAVWDHRGGVPINSRFAARRDR